MTSANSFRFIDLSYLETMADGDEDMRQTMLEMLLEELPGESPFSRLAVAPSQGRQRFSAAHRLVLWHVSSAAIRPLGLLGEIRLLGRVLGHPGIGHHRSDSGIPAVRH